MKVIGFYQKFDKKKQKKKTIRKRTVITDIFITAESSDLSKWLLKHVDLGLFYSDQVVSFGTKDSI